MLLVHQARSVCLHGGRQSDPPTGVTVHATCRHTRLCAENSCECSVCPVLRRAIVTPALCHMFTPHHHGMNWMCGFYR